MYAELHCLSSFSFLRGASMPQELVERAAALGYAALALTDECSMAGVVRAHGEAKRRGLKFIVGSEFALADGMRLVVLAANRNGYGRLCRLITRGRRAAKKGAYLLGQDNFSQGIDDCLVLLLPPAGVAAAQVRWFADRFPGRAWLAVQLLRAGDDGAVLARLTALGAELGLPLLAAGGVHMHVRERRVLHDVMTAIRLNRPVAEAGHALQPNGERHLRPLSVLQRLYPRALLDETLRVAGLCAFSLDELRYEYPDELVPSGHTACSWLQQLTEEGARRRWPDAVPARIRAQIEHELQLIRELHYEAYFLTVQELVAFARERGILCQGRGSAANSVVCYCLGITSVDPAAQSLLFERFISRERNEPPDIDVDFEHERREEVIQHLYAKYGRHRAALAATVITYRHRSAWRDVGMALGSPDHPLSSRLVEELNGFPRHLSQHVGGFVISRGPLEELVPIENAGMADRTVIQWDKDDLESLGLLKVDVLALGMLTALKRAFDFHHAWSGERLTLASIPREDPQVYGMIQKADTIGVFQIESRAQMSMLPRLKPRNYYDLVIQIAIVRPGPIQGDMVHPYLRRRNGEEPEDYPDEAVRAVLARTLGVPIFQEQVMQLAMVAAGFTAGEADELRRSMAAWQRCGSLERFRVPLLEGMRARGHDRAFAERVYKQIQGFGEYGFPESHSASFALLAYASAWFKCHHPAIFTAALLNSQPMGFYRPSQLIQDARRHQVQVRPADVLQSDRDCTLEGTKGDAPALRLGLRLVRGLSRAGVDRLVAARNQCSFDSVHDLAARSRLDRRDLQALAAGGALAVLTGNRRYAAWEIAGIEKPLPLLDRPPAPEGLPLLRPPTEGQNVRMDYGSLGFTLGRHPLAFLRRRLRDLHIASAAEVHAASNGKRVRAAGLVIGRQRPATASGVTFVTLEDETGHLNLIVRPAVAEANPRVFMQSQLLEVQGRVQRAGQVLHILAQRLVDHSQWLGPLSVHSRDFH